MGQKQPDKSPREKINFVCPQCSYRFECPPARHEEDEDRPHHPFRYFADCPQCDTESPQAHWEINLFKAYANATGPKTEEGKAISAANLDGHPTPEEAQLTRFNAMKHGAYAKTAKFFPARPGKYPQCDGCEHQNEHYADDSACVRHKACLKQVEVFVRYQSAFDAKDPNLLLELQGHRQAAIQSLIDMMILTINQDGGPRIKTVEWYYDKDGSFHLAQWKDDDDKAHQIYKLEEHPLLKPLIDYINKNSMTLSDLGMTPKVQDDQDMMKGFLDHEKGDKEAAQGFQQRIEKQQDTLLSLIQDSYDEADVIDVTPSEADNG
ncbi:MAG TPA: hypothetical protein ENJ35_00280 [Gammaproteobacteria bacterium]|nr:hypothetical protein [Gammaproteobacteria bacterium]